MEEVLKKVSSYQLFNYLLSGAVLVAALNETTEIHLTSDDVVISFFVIYFVGMVASRLGSLVVEPTLKFLKVIRFRPYEEYVRAAQLDQKLDTLSQENNTYRTLIAAFIMYATVYTLNKHAHSVFEGHSSVVLISGTFSLLVLFSFAYRKQTQYITKRIVNALQG